MVAEATPMEEKRQRREEAGKEGEVGEERGDVGRVGRRSAAAVHLPPSAGR